MHFPNLSLEELKASLEQEQASLKETREQALNGDGDAAHWLSAFERDSCQVIDALQEDIEKLSEWESIRRLEAYTNTLPLYPDC